MFAGIDRFPHFIWELQIDMAVNDPIDVSAAFAKFATSLFKVWIGYRSLTKSFGFESFCVSAGCERQQWALWKCVRVSFQCGGHTFHDSCWCWGKYCPANQEHPPSQRAYCRPNQPVCGQAVPRHQGAVFLFPCQPHYQISVFQSHTFHACRAMKNACWKQQTSCI